MTTDPLDAQWICGTRGEQIRLVTGVDLTGATALSVVVSRPDSETVQTVTSAVIRDPADATAALWTVNADQLDVPGVYELRVRAFYPGGGVSFSKIPAILEASAL